MLMGTDAGMYSGAEVAPFLGVTTPSVNRLAVSEELPECRTYLNALQNLSLLTVSQPPKQFPPL